MSVHSEANDSTRSSTPDSTSTHWYDELSPPHEAYETFQHKVVELTHSICEAKEVTLQRIRGGCYNRVVVAHVKLTNGGELSGIYRIPRSRDIPDGVERNSNEDIETDIIDQVAVLQLLGSQAIPAPRLIAYDASGKNAIESPYVFQHFSEGTMLENIYGDMAFEEKMQLAVSLADFLARMEAVTFDKSGLVVAAPTGNAAPATKASSFCAPLGNVAVAVGGFTDPYENVHTSHTATSPRELIGELLRARLDGEVALNEPPSEFLAMRLRMVATFEDMCQLGIFDDNNLTGGSILYHWDLQPRNILVKTIRTSEHEEQALELQLERCLSIAAPSGRWVIDTVVDWDNVQSVPPIFTRQPPIWLWDFSGETGGLSLPPGYDSDSDLQPASRYDSSEGKLSSDAKQIQANFEDRLVNKLQQIYPTYNARTYRDEAYGRGRWIRRMARFAIHGVRSSEDTKRFRGLEKEWITARSHFANRAANISG
ncbi:hypothetical protein CBER1_02200 [Cercospora berteroae]|uniref:Uncharacterized protein n=1 Tax=Cercospora berteroae TaxID=357750 RepID=A0A2S6BQB5_9PEZI|nr:hypothetical protein CBER1_02200 [Cercospora berteroae]